MKHYKTITVIAGDYPAEGHQMLVFVQQLVHAMIDLGQEVTVVAPQSIIHAIMHKQKLLPRRSIGTTDLGHKYEIFRPITLSFGNVKLFTKIFSWYNRLIITRKVSSINSNIIYSHFWSSAIPIYKYALLHNIPLFVACGEGDNALESMVSSMPQEDLNVLASAVTGVVSVSSENKRKCVIFGLAKDENIEVFPNCVNTSIFHKMDVRDRKKQLGIKDDDFVISFVGGFINRKGPDRIAKAITLLNNPNIKVMFIGKSFPGYNYDFECEGIIHKGPLDHDCLPEYINCSDVFVMPTLKEGCCNAIVEALAMGIPVISSDGAFNDDILDEKNSIRLDPNDVDAIAAAIKLLKENPSLRQEMSDYSLSKHNEYSISGRAMRILNFIHKQIKSK